MTLPKRKPKCKHKWCLALREQELLMSSSDDIGVVLVTKGNITYIFICSECHNEKTITKKA